MSFFYSLTVLLTFMPSKSWYQTQIKDEGWSARNYRSHGYPKLARDELGHKRVLQRDLKRKH